MGRGLSPLQITAIETALTNRRKAAAGDPAFVDDKGARQGPDATYAEILKAHYGWPGETVTRNGRRIVLGNVFSAEDVGPTYRSGRSALSRATWRLHQRGLVTCLRGRYRWAGITLTEAGVRAAELLVDK